MREQLNRIDTQTEPERKEKKCADTIDRKRVGRAHEALRDGGHFGERSGGIYITIIMVVTNHTLTTVAIVMYQARAQAPGVEDGDRLLSRMGRSPWHGAPRYLSTPLPLESRRTHRML